MELAVISIILWGFYKGSSHQQFTFEFAVVILSIPEDSLGNAENLAAESTASLPKKDLAILLLSKEVSWQLGIVGSYFLRVKDY